MPSYLLYHQHAAAECRTAFAAWKGFRSALRGQAMIASCRYGGHQIWWQVEADSLDAAIALLPAWYSGRTSVARVGEVRLP